MNKTEALKALKNMDDGDVAVSQLKEEISALKMEAFERGKDPSARLTEATRGCLPLNSQTKWNTAAVAWRKSRACR